MVEELLLGDNPFIGVSHLAQGKAREEAKEASLENKVKVLEAAAESGATGFTFSTHESNLELLTYVRDHNPDLLNELNYYILAPYTNSYVRRANIGGTPALIKSTLKEMVRSRSAALGMLEGIMSMSPERLAGPFIETEIDPFLKVLPKERVECVFLHEVLTELVIAFDLTEVLRSLDGYLKKRVGLGFGLETRNFGHLRAYLSESGYSPEYLMTPLNPLGYQMAPSKGAVEEAVNELGGASKIIAVNTMASGAATLEGAIEYLGSFKDKIYGVTTASTKAYRIRENFQRLSRAFLS